MAGCCAGSHARQTRNKWRMSCLKLRKRLKPLVKLCLSQSCAAGLQEKDKSPNSSSLHEQASEDLSNTLKQLMQMSSLGAATFYRSWLSQSSCSGTGRLRDLFPIPPLTEWPGAVKTGTASKRACFDFSNMCLAALNCLNTGMKPSVCDRSMRKTPSVAQQETQHHVCSQVAIFLQRVNACCHLGLAWQSSFQQCEASVSPTYETLRSNDVDLPRMAATCDPSHLVCEELRGALNSPQEIFPRATKRFLKRGGVTHEQRAEYVQLVARELKCGKLRLQKDAQGVGGVFAVGKTGGRQRKIWNGSALSAAVPPKPHRLANPSSFLDIDLFPGEKVFFSKRDAATFFDALQVPEPLQA